MGLVDIEHLNVTYVMDEKRVVAVRDVSISIERGKPLGVVGESGSGKSTLAMAMLRLLPKGAQVEGAVQFMGKDLLSCTDREMQELRWKSLSVVFQKSMNILSPVHKIGRQLKDIYRIHDDKASSKEIREKLEGLFTMVGLPERALDAYPHELSGGMLQRVSIASSLMHRPPFIIFDEATTALDVITQGQIIREIKKLRDAMDVTWLLITHDISVVSSCCETVAVLYAGELMEYGDVKTVIAHPAHPYTQGLLHSFPTLHGEKSNLKGISGTMPDLSVEQKGCVFASRCPFAQAKCLAEHPSQRSLGENHTAACFFAGEMN